MTAADHLIRLGMASVQDEVEEDHSMTTARSKATAQDAENPARTLHIPAPASGGAGPIEMDLDLIDEDPNQPRTADNPGFARESLEELAATIRLRGVKTPISVRDQPHAPGRYVINHGARRFRASRLAGRTTIPAFVDNDYNEADQVIENLQRNELTAREIADFIGRELAKGHRKADIARSIGKSAAFVTQHVALLDLPDPVARVFNSGRTRDVTVVNELLTAYRRNREEVTDWLADETQEITRGSVRLLREFLDDRRRTESGRSAADGVSAQEDFAEAHQVEDEGRDARQGDRAPAMPAADRLRKTIVQVRHDGRPARLILNRRPPAQGMAWLRYEDDGHEVEADLAQVRLVALLEG